MKTKLFDFKVALDSKKKKVKFEVDIEQALPIIGLVYNFSGVRLARMPLKSVNFWLARAGNSKNLTTARFSLILDIIGGETKQSIFSRIKNLGR